MYRTFEQIFSDRIQVKHNPQVTLRLTADDWQLYSGKGTSMDYDINRDTVAKLINDYVARLLQRQIAGPRHTKRQADTFACSMTTVRQTVKAGRCWTISFIQYTGRVNDVVRSYKYTQSLG